MLLWLDTSGAIYDHTAGNCLVHNGAIYGQTGKAMNSEEINIKMF